jgi:hypothetical protein
VTSNILSAKRMVFEAQGVAAGMTPTRCRDMCFPHRQHRVPALRHEDGSSAEIAVVGNEACSASPCSWAAKAPREPRGGAERGLPAQSVRAEKWNSGTTAHCGNLLLRYTQALITQMAQTAVCNRHHAVDQQLAVDESGLAAESRLFRIRTIEPVRVLASRLA